MKLAKLGTWDMSELSYLCRCLCNSHSCSSELLELKERRESIDYDMKFGEHWSLITMATGLSQTSCLKITKAVLSSGKFGVTTIFLNHSTRTQELENSNLSVAFLGSFLSCNKNEKQQLKYSIYQFSAGNSLDRVVTNRVMLKWSGWGKEERRRRKLQYFSCKSLVKISIQS